MPTKGNKKGQTPTAAAPPTLTNHHSLLEEDPNTDDATCERPVPLVTYNKFKYSTTNARQFFMAQGFQDMEVSVIAVTGRSARGKTLILSYLLRYANFRFVFNQHEDEWLHDDDLPCDGWKWKGDDSNVGISVWSDFFVFQTPERKNAAILVLGTEGITNQNADSTEAHAILALAALSSSVQIHVIQTRIQDDDLDDVELATMYAKLISDKTRMVTTKSFQKLICVVSDWPQDDDLFGELGFAGGWEYLMREEDKKRIKVHEHIKTYYSEVRGFLLPESGDPKGGMKKSTLKFKETLKQLAESVLAPEHAKLKIINEKHVKVSDLFKHLEQWMVILNGPEAPVVHVGYKTSVDIQMIIAKEAAYRAYNRNMIDVFSSRRHMSKDELELYNRRGLKAALAAFERVPKLEADPNSREELKEELAVLYGAYSAKNQHRKTWYYTTYDALNRVLLDTSFTIWLTLFVVYSLMEKFAPKSRFVRILDHNFVVAKRAFVISYIIYLLYSAVLKE